METGTALGKSVNRRTLFSDFSTPHLPWPHSELQALRFSQPSSTIKPPVTVHCFSIQLLINHCCKDISELVGLCIIFK